MRSHEHKSQILVVFSIRLGTKPVKVTPCKSGGGANGNRLDPTWEVQVDSSRLSQVFLKWLPHLTLRHISLWVVNLSWNKLLGLSRLQCMALNCRCLSDMQYGVISAHSFIYMLMILRSTDWRQLLRSRIIWTDFHNPWTWLQDRFSYLHSITVWRYKTNATRS